MYRRSVLSNQPNPDHLRRAIELATQNVLSGKGGPFAAVIVRDGKIIAEAANSVTTTNDPTAHGEVNAIRAACRELGTFTLTGCEIYSSCEPCPMCLGAIYWARIDKIYYANTKSDAAAIGFDDNYIYEELKAEMEHRNLRFIQLLRDEAQHTFKLWESSASKTNY